HLRTKQSLILEKKRYEIHKALSDLNGVDVKCHNNKPLYAVRALQHWLIETVGMNEIESPSVLWRKFNNFIEEFSERRKAQGYSKSDLRVMPVPQYIKFIKQWIASKR